MTSKHNTNEILLDAGTNELEVLVFRLSHGLFGVNVAKVREVIRRQPPTASPHMHPSVLGMINIRGSVLPLVDLCGHLALERLDTAEQDLRVIVTEFNGLQAGFVVDGVEQIHRINWNQVKPAPDLQTSNAQLNTVAASTCTGVLELQDRLVLMVDFESVCDSILQEDRLHLSEPVDNPHQVDRSTCRVVVAEDSPFMRELLTKTLREAGYANVDAYQNGGEAWKAIQNAANEGKTMHCLVSDIEMPQMDGLHLTKRVRELTATRDVPIILFSSLISEDNRKKGQQVGATIQVAKPEMRQLIDLVDQAICGKLQSTATRQAA
ncbi:MAG: chemotaxis protein CheV [Phycisphaerales bacterium]|nr:MAG: chemotaxis protein CheV [Phycisphaerales bacterium]